MDRLNELINNIGPIAVDSNEGRGLNDELTDIDPDLTVDMFELYFTNENELTSIIQRNPRQELPAQKLNIRPLFNGIKAPSKANLPEELIMSILTNALRFPMRSIDISTGVTPRRLVSHINKTLTKYTSISHQFRRIAQDPQCIKSLFNGLKLRIENTADIKTLDYLEEQGLLPNSLSIRLCSRIALPLFMQKDYLQSKTKKIDIAKLIITQEKLDQVKGLITSNPVTHLTLASNQCILSGERSTFTSLIETFPLTGIEYLKIEHNNLDSEDAKSIAAVLKETGSRITHLDISWNKISNAGATAIAEALPLSKVKYLNMLYNKDIDQTHKEKLRAVCSNLEITLKG